MVCREQPGPLPNSRDVHTAPPGETRARHSSPRRSLPSHLTGEDQRLKTHEFTLILTADPSDAQADKLYGICNDGTLSTVSGVAQIDFHRDANSLEEALRSALADVCAAGLRVKRVEMAPKAVLLPM